MDEVFYNEMEDEVLEIFLYIIKGNIKIEANNNKNQEDGVIIEDKLFQCEVNKISKIDGF